VAATQRRIPGWRLSGHQEIRVEVIRKAGYQDFRRLVLPFDYTQGKLTPLRMKGIRDWGIGPALQGWLKRTKNPTTTGVGKTGQK